MARDEAPALLAAIDRITVAAPFRRMVTPGGWRMSVAMTNCGPLGWVTDQRGYRYDPLDPERNRPWPAMPALFRDLADRAAARAGFAKFRPDACLINRYEPGSRLSLHQDRNEVDFGQPIVSVSLGVAATFLWGGNGRADPVRRLRLEDGDVMVWGGEDRLRFHGVAPVNGAHPHTGFLRYNLTFRRAGA
jgi:alkylated DNA repair protein (DNA oxidative demethylase)